MFSNVVIMILNYVLYPILVQNPENCHFEVLHIFLLPKHTATRKSTIRKSSRCITSTERTLNGLVYYVIAICTTRRG